MLAVAFVIVASAVVILFFMLTRCPHISREKVMGYGNKMMERCEDCGAEIWSDIPELPKRD